MASVNKKDLAARAAAQEGISVAAAERIIDTVFGDIGSHVNNGDEVRVHNFGTFSLQERAARPGRNPSTGEPIQIAASTSIKFKPTKRSK